MSGQNKYIAMIVLQSVLYGVMDIVSKLVYQVMPVYGFLFLRYVLAAVIMLVIWKNTIIPELKTANWRTYIVPGLCMSCAFIFSNLALQYTTATNVSFIRSLSAILAPVLLLLFFHQKYQRRDVALQILMVLGLYLLCIKGGLHGVGLGELLSFLAALLVAGSLVFGKQALNEVSAISLSFVQTFLAVFVCGIMCCLTGAAPYLIKACDWKIVLALIYAAVGCTIGGYLLQNIALQHISPKIAGMVQCLYPVATAGLAYFVLAERLSLLGMLGAAVIILTVLLESVWNSKNAA